MTTDSGAPTAPPRSTFRPLSREECWDRLCSEHVGRVAWNSSGRPQLLPVSYAVAVDTLVFRTAPYGALAELQNRQQVAFQVDRIDQGIGHAWSVLVHGIATAVADPESLSLLWSEVQLTPWAPGTRNLFIRIAPQEITGRLTRSPFAL